MINLIRGEFYKLRKSKYFIGVFFLTLAVSFFLKRRWDITEHILSSENSCNLIYGIYSIATAFEYIGSVIFMFALLAGEFIANDFKNRTLSKSFIYGYNRSKVVISKLIVAITYFLFIELIYTVILVIYASRHNGFCEVLNFSTMLYLIRIIVVGVMYNVAIMCIVSMVAIITKNNLYTIASAVIYLFTMIFIEGSPNLKDIFFWMPHIAGVNAIQIFSSRSEIVRSIILSMLTFIITIGGSLLYVKHGDIK